MFRNKVVIITGSTQGIGLKTAELLAIRGASIVINSRSEKKVGEALKHLVSFTPRVTGIAGDVGQFEFCQELCKHAIDQFGKIDILINNAGVASGGLMKDSVAGTFELVFNTNLLGSVYMTLACMNEIRRQKGSVLFISSVAGIVGLPSYSAYGASKRALVSFAESLRNELVDDDVFVGVNYPGFTENDAGKTIINAKGEEELLRKRSGVIINSKEETASKIIEQLQKRKFRVYSSSSGRVVDKMYRFFPKLTLFLVKRNRQKIVAMQ